MRITSHTYHFTFTLYLVPIPTSSQLNSPLSAKHHAAPSFLFGPNRNDPQPRLPAIQDIQVPTYCIRAPNHHQDPCLRNRSNPATPSRSGTLARNPRCRVHVHCIMVLCTSSMCRLGTTVAPHSRHHELVRSGHRDSRHHRHRRPAPGLVAFYPVPNPPLDEKCADALDGEETAAANLHPRAVEKED